MSQSTTVKRTTPTLAMAGTTFIFLKGFPHPVALYTASHQMPTPRKFAGLYDGCMVWERNGVYMTKDRPKEAIT